MWKQSKKLKLVIDASKSDYLVEFQGEMWEWVLGKMITGMTIALASLIQNMSNDQVDQVLPLFIEEVRKVYNSK